MAPLSPARSGSTMAGSSNAASSSAISVASVPTGPTPSITAATALLPDISPTSWLKEPIVMPGSIST
jgi:hypothetical protein